MSETVTAPGLAGGVLAVVLGTAPLGCAHPAAPPAPAPAPPPRASALLGGTAPVVRGRTLDGRAFGAGETTGRVVVVDFFAAYCAPCRQTLPRLQALHRRRPELAIVGVSLDEDAAAARALVARYGLTFPVIHDPARALAGRFRVTELPASFVADREGNIAWAGDDDPAGTLARAAEHALGQPRAPLAQRR
jgi:peroxiredoxin